MTDTTYWILLLAVAVAMGTALTAQRTANQALRIARGGGGGASGTLLSRADRKAAELLAQRATALLAKVNALPPVLLGPGADGKVREATLWVAAEVASLKDTTPAMAAVIAEPLAAVEPAMTWLLERTQAIRATQRGSGEYLIDFPHDLWRRNHQGAVTGLQEMVARGETGAK